MKKNLLIVESEAKCNTIRNFLGPEFDVVACHGHVKNLPGKRLGIDVSQKFLPQFEVLRGKRELIEKLRLQSQNASFVFIATDPDREGEAIASDLIELLNLKKSEFKRIRFNEISALAIRKALDNPTELNNQTVASQNARRVIDRLWGYEISPFLWKNICPGTSSGRVQSVALHFIVEKEKTRKTITDNHSWTCFADLYFKTEKLAVAQLVSTNSNPFVFRSESAATEWLIKNNSGHQKTTIQTTQFVDSDHQPPFTTSTFLQTTANKLGFSARKTMRIAHELYDGSCNPGGIKTGLITYFRTDSTRISQAEQSKIHIFIKENLGDLPIQPEAHNRVDPQTQIQNAHEAIRPVDFGRTPAELQQFLSTDHLQVYELIWQNTLTSQMKQNDATRYKFEVKVGQNASWQALVAIPAYLQKLNNYIINKSNFAFQEFVNNKNCFVLKEFQAKKMERKEMRRFNEAELIRLLDKNGIGRPATFASIVPKLRRRGYIAMSGTRIKSTALGEAVHATIEHNFSHVFNTNFTFQMENKLDEIENGNKDYFAVVNTFYTQLKAALDSAKAVKSKSTDDQPRCPNCGQKLFVRLLRGEKTLSCSGYPDCYYSVSPTELRNEKVIH
ncbi:MAG: type I DNA topoisomerase [Calditrichaeota bacterium]|nr:MAG: type I DNA topoisomerase [Calditrichota bacterium]